MMLQPLRWPPQPPAWGGGHPFQHHPTGVNPALAGSGGAEPPAVPSPMGSGGFFLVSVVWKDAVDSTAQPLVGALSLQLQRGWHKGSPCALGGGGHWHAWERARGTQGTLPTRG